MEVFISYRRLDGNLQALLVHKELEQRLPGDTIFMDVADIGWGDDFVQAIDARLARADVVIVIIGKHWLEMLQARQRGDDWVRHEVTTALRLRAASLTAGGKARPRVLPVLVDAAAQIDKASLPESLQALASLNTKGFDEHASESSLNQIVEAVRGEKDVDVVERERWRRIAFHASWAVGALLAIASLTSLLDVVGLDTRARTLTLALASVGRDAAALPWSDSVVWVAIDTETQIHLNRPLDESWRKQHAQVIEIAHRAGARALAFDLSFEDAGPAEADAALERALRAARSPIGAAGGSRPPLPWRWRCNRSTPPHGSPSCCRVLLRWCSRRSAAPASVPARRCRCRWHRCVAVPTCRTARRSNPRRGCLRSRWRRGAATVPSSR